MKILAVDDERLALRDIMNLLKKAVPEADAVGFTKIADGFTYLFENQVDVVLLDMDMGAMSGIAAAKRCKEIFPDVRIIFVTGHSRNIVHGSEKHSSGYLMKPVRVEELRDELDDGNSDVPCLREQRVRIQTFGHFTVFVDHQPLFMEDEKYMECLAYLVHRRGALVNVQELSAVLWKEMPQDRKTWRNSKKVMAALMKSLKRAGIRDIVKKTEGGLAIDTEKVNCDCYGFLNGDAAQINAYGGVYMNEYEWGEFSVPR